MLLNIMRTRWLYRSLDSAVSQSYPALLRAAFLSLSGNRVKIKLSENEATQSAVIGSLLSSA